jgi:hypothetical protein
MDVSGMSEALRTVDVDLVVGEAPQGQSPKLKAFNPSVVRVHSHTAAEAIEERCASSRSRET